MQASSTEEKTPAPTPARIAEPRHAVSLFLNTYPYKALVCKDGEEIVSALYLLLAKLDDKDIYWGMDLQSEHERYICEKVVNGPVFLTDYPKDIKAFYMRLNDDGKTVAACDLLVPFVGELIGGSQREERYDYLVKRMKELDMKSEGLEWYLNLRRYGGCKHAGFGVGFERLVMYVTGMQNIRDVIPFARTPKNLLF